jgi:hypothetical protein
MNFLLALVSLVPIASYLVTRLFFGLDPITEFKNVGAAAKKRNADVQTPERHRSREVLLPPPPASDPLPVRKVTKRGQKEVAGLRRNLCLDRRKQEYRLF